MRPRLSDILNSPAAEYEKSLRRIVILAPAFLNPKMAIGSSIHKSTMRPTTICSLITFVDSILSCRHSIIEHWFLRPLEDWYPKTPIGHATEPVQLRSVKPAPAAA
jgi:hypothetical protein